MRFEESRRIFEFAEKDVLGPGFGSVASVHLPPGQVRAQERTTISFDKGLEWLNVLRKKYISIKT